MFGLWRPPSLSLERIAAITGRHPSTVGHWVKRHGLSAVHRDRHAPKGGISREALAALVDDGLSTREIADRLGLSQGTVRHWLRKYDLRTHRARHDNSHGVGGVHPDRAVMDSPRHVRAEFWLEARGIYRCLRCRSEAVARRRRKLKETLVQEAGGACVLCGYDRYIGALQFHLRDGDTKQFGLADRGLTRSLEAVARRRRSAPSSAQLPLGGAGRYRQAPVT
jgi:DNA-binding transcriptional ArsR family regulator